MSLVLAADTSTGVISIALLQGRKVLAELSVNAPKRHAERLVPMTEALLAEADMRLEDVALFAVSIGPGSFTGLRIGVATWKGFALACGKPLIGVSTLDAMARGSGVHNGIVGVALDAKMREVYGAIYRVSNGKWNTLDPMMVGPVEALLEKADWIDLLIGDGTLAYREEILAIMPDIGFGDASQMYPRAGVVALEALDRWEAGDTGNGGDVNPVYLRQSQAEETKRQQELMAGTV